MIRKLAIYMFFLSTLNGCAQSFALLGPVFSYSQSGSISQSALSYGTNKTFKKIKNRTSNTKKENTLSDDRLISNSYSYLLVKNKIENASSIKNLSNQ